MTVEERRKVWVEALRNGGYKQGNTFLRRDDTYCCLGVACDVYKELTGDCEWKVANQNEEETVYHFVTEKSFWAERELCQSWLPSNVAEFFDMSVNGVIGEEVEHQGSMYVSLTDMNDCGKMSLADIADFVEKNPNAILSTKDAHEEHT